MALEPDMPDPDWDRHIIAQGPVAPVGNPIRWGWVAVTPLNQDVPPDANGIITYRTGPIVTAAAADGYARSWSIVGTLSMPFDALYTSFAPPTYKPGSYPRPSTDGINVMLDIALGVGQITLNQRILLAASGEPTLGLCNQQGAVFSAGPYCEIHSTDPVLSAVSVSRSFAAIGSLVANAITIRGFYELNGVGAKSPLPSVLTVGVSPYAAGTKL